MQEKKLINNLFIKLIKFIPQLANAQDLIQSVTNFMLDLNKIPKNSGQSFFNFNKDEIYYFNKDDWHKIEDFLITTYRTNKWYESSKVQQIIQSDNFNDKLLAFSNKLNIELNYELKNKKNALFGVIEHTSLYQILLITVSNTQRLQHFINKNKDYTLTKYDILNDLSKGLSGVIYSKYDTKIFQEKLNDFIKLLLKENKINPYFRRKHIKKINKLPEMDTDTKKLKKKLITNLPDKLPELIYNIQLNKICIYSGLLQKIPQYLTSKLYNYLITELNNIFMKTSTKIYLELINEGLILPKNKWINNKEYTLCEWATKHFNIFLSSELPRIRKFQRFNLTETFSLPNLPGIPDSEITTITLRKSKPNIHQSWYIDGNYSEKTEEMLSHMFHQKYHLNIYSMTAFLTLLLELFENKLDINIKLNLLTELYRINLKTCKENVIDFALDFNNMLFYNMSTEIGNHLRSYKYSLLELLIQLFIMNNFNFFYYDWFFDSRGRIYMSSSLTLYNLYARSLISFYIKFNIKNPVIAKEKQYLKLQQMLKAQLNSYLNFSNITLETLSLKDLLNKNRSWKVGQFIYVYSLLHDYLNFIQDKNFNLNSYFSLDAVSSGLQIISLIFKDKSLAKYVNLHGNNLDIYSYITQLLNSKLKTILDFSENDQSFLNNTKELESLQLPFIENESLDSIELQQNERIFSHFNYTELFAELPKKSNSEQFYDFKSYLKLFQDFLPLKRSIIKINIMTMGYASTIYGRRTQIFDKIKEESLQSGKFLTQDQLKCLPNFCSMLEKYITYLITKKFSLILNLPQVINKSIKNDTFKDYLIQTAYFRYIIRPYKYDNIKLNVGKSSINLRQYNSNIDTQKLAKSWGANFVQSIDAIIAYQFINQYKLLYCFCNHDCYFVTPLACLSLKGKMKKIYLNIFKKGRKFKTSALNQLKSNTLTIKDLDNDNFIKF